MDYQIEKPSTSLTGSKGRERGLLMKTVKCPECGCDKVITEMSDTLGDGHRVCKQCLQEWYTDIDYTA